MYIHNLIEVYIYKWVLIDKWVNIIHSNINRHLQGLLCALKDDADQEINETSTLPSKSFWSGGESSHCKVQYLLQWRCHKVDSLGTIKEGSLEEVMSSMRLKGYKRSLPNKEMAETLLIKKKKEERKKLPRKGYFMQRHHRVCGWRTKVFKQKRIFPEFSSGPKLRSTYCNCRLLIICEITCVMSAFLAWEQAGSFHSLLQANHLGPTGFLMA